MKESRRHSPVVDKPLLFSECTCDSYNTCVHRRRWRYITKRRRVSGNGLFHHGLNRELMEPNRNSFLSGVSGHLHHLERSATHPSSLAFRAVLRTCTPNLVRLYPPNHDPSVIHSSPHLRHPPKGSIARWRLARPVRPGLPLAILEMSMGV